MRGGKGSTNQAAALGRRAGSAPEQSRRKLIQYPSGFWEHAAVEGVNPTASGEISFLYVRPARPIKTQDDGNQVPRGERWLDNPGPEHRLVQLT